MKKTSLFFGTILALAAVSCTMEDNLQEPQLQEQEITIKAVREGDDLETRTYRDDSDGSVWWVPGDAISLFYGSGTDGGSKFTSTSTENSKVTNFTGTITAITGGGEISVEDTFFWGLYPYSEDASCDGTSVTMTLPGNQTAVPGTFATNTFPSLGRSQGLIMGFYNICSGMKFSVTKEGIKKVTLKSRSGELITGKAKVRFDNGIPAAEIIDGSDEVVLEAPAGEYFEVGKFYFIVMFPTTFTNGFTLTLETFTEEATVEKTGKLTARRSNFGKIANIDANASYSQKTGNIPVEDANFKAYLVENFDGNGDGEISYEEALNITSINVCTDDIESVSGIEYMKNLEALYCHGSGVSSSGSSGRLSSLDVSNNTALAWLYCHSNQLTSMDVSNNTTLRYLSCFGNLLTCLDVSNNTALTNLWCYHNQLTSLDVSNNTALIRLECYNNQLTGLDLSNNTVLITLSCYSNHLNNLDVSNNSTMTYLDCGGNQISSIDVSMITTLKSLYCGGNKLTSIDVSNNTALTNFDCSGNKLTSLDVSQNTDLAALYCDMNLLTDLDLSNNTELERLQCGADNMTTIDLSGNIKLTYLSLQYGGNFETVDLSNNTALTYLYCVNNKLTSLNISNNTALEHLYCSRNQLINLDVSKNSSLTYLDCSPMSTLATLYIYQGQEIPNVTINRDVNNIPAETEIVIAPDDGGGEGTGEDPWG